MNCGNCQDLLSDFIDGSLLAQDQNRVETHLSLCSACAEARSDLDSIVGFCLEHRGEYDAVPNEQALWLRISNLIEAELASPSRPEISERAGWWFRLVNRRWQLSFPQLAASTAAIVIVVALGTVVGVRRFQDQGSQRNPIVSTGLSVEERYRQQQQVIDYWNQRVELNKARWSAQMRETFEYNMSVYDGAVNDSMRKLNQNPHDEVSEEILNAALNDKVALLKEFSAL